MVLNLCNAFVQVLDKSQKLPVMFFIHGGVFIYASSQTFEPHYFMDEDVVLVTINYRLGALGIQMDSF